MREGGRRINRFRDINLKMAKSCVKKSIGRCIIKKTNSKNPKKIRKDIRISLE